MIIYSTTLNTEAKVIEIYGGITWIQHYNYILRGAQSGVTSNSATKTGGNDNAVAVNHSHSYKPAGSVNISTNAAVTNSGSHTISGGAHGHRIRTYNYGKVAGKGSDYPAIGQNGTQYNTQMCIVDDTTGGHSHTVSNHTHTMTQASYTFSGTNATISLTGEDGTNANIPNYKSVYIWERTA